MKKTKLLVRHEGDGYRVLSFDGVEYWDVDGPFETEEEAIKAMDTIQKEWNQAYPE